MSKYAFTNGFLLDGSKEMLPQSGLVLLVEGDLITGICKETELPDGYEIIDLQEAYLMPGLINLHVHLAGSGKPKKKSGNPVLAAKLITTGPIMRALGHRMVAGYAKTQLMSGVTTIRTVGGLADFDTFIRDRIREGKQIGPRILASNMAISVPGGHMAKSLGYEAHSPKEAAHFVDVIAKDHPDLIKLMITGGVMDAEVVGEPGLLRMQPDIVRAACERAHELGYLVAAHVESPEGVRVALENGVDSIEHGAKPSANTMELMKKNHAFQVSTISPALPYALFDRSVSGATYEQQENGRIVFDGIIDMAKECLANDIPVGLGTDTACPYITQYDMWRELLYYTKYCGVSNQFALYSATLLNAELAGIGDITGSLEVGKKAELIVTKGNPLEDLTKLRQIQMVMAFGKLHRSPKVKKIIEAERELDRFI